MSAIREGALIHLLFYVLLNLISRCRNELYSTLRQLLSDFAFVLMHSIIKFDEKSTNKLELNVRESFFLLKLHRSVKILWDCLRTSDDAEKEKHLFSVGMRIKANESRNWVIKLHVGQY